MSDDLISRKAVIDYLREQNNNVIIEKHKDGFVYEDTCRGMEGAISAFRNFILTLPTAFDKEKVIEELTAGKFITIGCDTVGESVNIRIDRAVEIVEKGGIG